ncbi:carboxyl-terminal protease [sediment metagenome]|uniref:Carboxyl-terminal protease n=1 Tax=sediment metagenome TaxID=749907 RepID=D9PIM3_9ZZZZ
MNSATPTPSKARFGKYIGIYLAIILFVCAFGLGVLAGQAYYVRKQIQNENGQIEISKVINLNRTLNKSDEVNFYQFWEIWDKIKQKYVNTNVKDVDLFYGAIEGMVYALGDPYSVYMVPKTADEFAKDLSGEFEGIGAEIGIKGGQLTVVAPLTDSPAEKAGLRAGDKILSIDKASTFGMDVNTAVSQIRGKAGTEVVLVITRNGAGKAFEVKITREKINVPSVNFSWQGDKVAYIRVLQFNEDTETDFDRYVSRLAKEGAKGIVLDLRNNPGGFLDTAVSMSSEWIENGVIVSEKSENGYGKDHPVVGGHRLVGYKTVVLVNGGSASASEIVAGALQDHGKAIVLGEKTFGKGSVQDFETFEDGSALKLTVAEWYTPNGRNINKDGIRPDIEFKEDWENEKIGEDKMLEKALELLTAKQWPPEKDKIVTTTTAEKAP